MSEQTTNSDHRQRTTQRSKRHKWTSEQLEKRRKIERDAQRIVRERTKDRISVLQNTIDSLLSHQGEDGVQTLTRQVREQQDEIDRLKKQLNGIKKIIQTAGFTDSEPATTRDATSSTTGGAMLTEVVEDTIGSSVDDSLHYSLFVNDRITASQQKLPFLDQQDVCSSGVSTSNPSNLLNEQRYPPIGLVNFASPSDGLQASTTSPSAKFGELATFAPNTCSTICAPKPIWEQVDDGLSKAPSHRTEISIARPERDNDICIRAILHGWSSAEQHHDLDAGWQILRYIDQSVFLFCGIIERIAIMRIMRLTMLRDINPTQVLDSLPAFMELRPTQKLIKHPKIIDYFVWPELRDYLILAPHKHSPAKLHRLIPANICFSWPYAPSAVLKTNLNTSLYTFSSAFDTSFQSLNCWMLCPDFFRECPEMIGATIISNPFPDAWNTKITGMRREESGILQDFAGDERINEDDGNNDDLWVTGYEPQSFIQDNGLLIPSHSTAWPDQFTNNKGASMRSVE